MLGRAFTTPRKSPKHNNENSFRSASIHEYDDCIIGFMDDLPLIACDDGGGGRNLTLREVLRASVGVMGESRLGMTEKVVLLGGRIVVAKRFRKVKVRRREYGRRIERVAQVSRECGGDFLVPVTAFLYSKRIKIVVCDYYPMGSLADLLSGSRNLGQTALNWKQRLKIIIHTAKAIAFIHSQNPHQDNTLQTNVHGNIKSSNIMITVDFSARLSDYGFVQLAEREELSGIFQEHFYSDNFSQKSDIYNFGIVILDVLSGARAIENRKCVEEKREEIRRGECEIFEFPVEGRERRQALKVLDIAMTCTNNSPEERPSIGQINFNLGKIIKSMFGGIM